MTDTAGCIAGQWGAPHGDFGELTKRHEHYLSLRFWRTLIGSPLLCFQREPSLRLAEQKEKKRIRRRDGECSRAGGGGPRTLTEVIDAQAALSRLPWGSGQTRCHFHFPRIRTYEQVTFLPSPCHFTYSVPPRYTAARIRLLAAFGLKPAQFNSLSLRWCLLVPGAERQAHTRIQPPISHRLPPTSVCWYKYTRKSLAGLLHHVSHQSKKSKNSARCGQIPGHPTFPSWYVVLPPPC